MGNEVEGVKENLNPQNTAEFSCRNAACEQRDNLSQEISLLNSLPSGARDYFQKNENNPQIVKAACNLFNERTAGKDLSPAGAAEYYAKGALTTARIDAENEAEDANTAYWDNVDKTRARDIAETNKDVEVALSEATKSGGRGSVELARKFINSTELTKEQKTKVLQTCDLIESTLDQVFESSNDPKTKAKLENIIANSRFDFSGGNNAEIFAELATNIENSGILTSEEKVAAIGAMGIRPRQNINISTGEDLKTSLSNNKDTIEKSADFIKTAEKSLEKLESRREELLEILYSPSQSQWSEEYQEAQRELTEIDKQIAEIKAQKKEAEEAKESANAPIKLAGGLTAKINPDNTDQMQVTAQMHGVPVKINLPRDVSGDFITEAVNAVALQDSLADNGFLDAVGFEKVTSAEGSNTWEVASGFENKRGRQIINAMLAGMKGFNGQIMGEADRAMIDFICKSFRGENEAGMDWQTFDKNKGKNALGNLGLLDSSGQLNVAAVAVASDFIRKNWPKRLHPERIRLQMRERGFISPGVSSDAEYVKKRACQQLQTRCSKRY